MSTDMARNDKLDDLVREQNGETPGFEVPEPPDTKLFDNKGLACALTLILASSDGKPHGRQILDVLDDVGQPISPGTLYPEIHALEDDGIVKRSELVQTKKILIDDDEAFEERITEYIDELNWLLSMLEEVQ